MLVQTANRMEDVGSQPMNFDVLYCAMMHKQSLFFKKIFVFFISKLYFVFFPRPLDEQMDALDY